MKNEETRNLEVVLSEETLLEYGKEQAKLLCEVVELEGKKALLTRQIKPKKERIEDLATAIDTGKQIQPVPCEWVYDYPRGKKDLIRTDTGATVVEDETILEWERQQHLGGM